MKNTHLWKLPQRLSVMLLVAFVAVMVSQPLVYHSNALLSSTPRKVLPGHLVKALANHKALRNTESGRQLQLSIGLKLRNTSELDALLAAQNDVRSPLYHKFLTPQEFTARFAPTQQSVDAVTAYLRSRGVKVNAVASNHLLINASSSASVVQTAFNTTIADYQLNGKTVYAPRSEPSVPANIAGIIQNIGGLDNVLHYRPMTSHPVTENQRPNIGPRGGFTPGEVRTAYDMNPLVSAGNDGTGQTVAIFELDGYTPSDINKYLSNYNLGSAKYSNVLVDGATNTAGAGAIEVELDMEVVSAVAPGANQKIYIGPNSASGVNDTYNKIVTDNVAKVTSISWGECESAIGSSELVVLDNIFKQGAAQGQAFFAASGDSGAYDCNDSNLAVDSPADDPNVVGVGGTNLHVGSGGTYSNESAWSNATDTYRSPKGSGGGGGISAQFARPSYQTGTNLTNADREVPDVSAAADPATGYSVYCTASAAGCSGWLIAGGTSAAAPLWAGIALDINKYLASAGASGLGGANATIYRLYNTAQPYPAYHDVVSGDNLYYPASSGYDNATGIGTPDTWNFARDVAATTGGGGGSTTTQKIVNGGFENNNASWTMSSSGSHKIIYKSIAHTGSYSAYLCGYTSCNDQIYQTVNVPSTTSKAVLSYWLNISSQKTETTCKDNFYARVRSSSDSTITTVQTKCNANASGWTRYTFDVTSALSSYKGRNVQIFFQGTTINAASPTKFFVDDVTFNITA